MVTKCLMLRTSFTLTLTSYWMLWHQMNRAICLAIDKRKNNVSKQEEDEGKKNVISNAPIAWHTYQDTGAFWMDNMKCSYFFAVVFVSNNEVWYTKAKLTKWSSIEWQTDKKSHRFLNQSYFLLVGFAFQYCEHSALHILFRS